MVNTPLILVSQNGSDDWSARYIDWLESHEPQACIVDLAPLREDARRELLAAAHGFVFTGGEDIDPVHYGKPYDVRWCYPPNPERDRREFEWMRVALDTKKAVLGVCRGLQILNIVRGGSLIIDLPTDHPSTVTHALPDRDAIHDVVVTPQSVLNLSDTPRVDTINSWHHQAVERVGDGLLPVGRAHDGIVEAVQGDASLPNVFGVQWHPERVTRGEIAEFAVAQAFLRAVRIVLGR